MIKVYYIDEEKDAQKPELKRKVESRYIMTLNTKIKPCLKFLKLLFLSYLKFVLRKIPNNKKLINQNKILQINRLRSIVFLFFLKYLQ